MLFSTKMMQNLMMDLLDFAQIEKNTFKLNKEFFNLFDAIK
jgi:signal transduction histidine kinase